MKVTLKTVEKAGQDGMTFAKLQKAFRQAKAAYVKAGVMGTAARAGDHTGMTNARLAAIHEYGLSSAPARPFIGPPFRRKRAEFIKKVQKAYREALDTSNPQLIMHELALIGQEMAADIKGWVTQGMNLAPNAPSTIAMKGSSRPLVDTGSMINSVTYQVVGGPPPPEEHHGKGGHHAAHGHAAHGHEGHASGHTAHDKGHEGHGAKEHAGHSSGKAVHDKTPAGKKKGGH